jgi:hypothetical protein
LNSDTTHPTISSHSPLPVVHDRQQLDAPLEHHQQKPLDRNLNLNRSSFRGSRSPEVTLVEQYTVSNAATSLILQGELFQNSLEQLQFQSLQSSSISSSFSPEAALPMLEPINSDSAPSCSMHKSVHFAVVQVHETTIIDGSYISTDSANSNHFDAEQRHNPYHNIKVTKSSSWRQNDPPSSESLTVHTVDEYEAQRQPQSRRYKQEGRVPKSNGGSRKDELRRILSTGTTTIATLSSIGTSRSNISEYVSVQELVPKQLNGRESTNVESNPPLSENANDIFQEYQRSFILDEEQQQQPNDSTRIQRGPWLSNSRSIPSLSRNIAAQPSQQQQSQRTGLLRRFFPKKDKNLKAII